MAAVFRLLMLAVVILAASQADCVALCCQWL